MAHGGKKEPPGGYEKRHRSSCKLHSHAFNWLTSRRYSVPYSWSIITEMGANVKPAPSVYPLGFGVSM